MKSAVALVATVLLAACQVRERMPTPPISDSKAELLRKAAELEASLPLEVREKIAELRKQSDALPRPTDLRRETLRSIKDQDLDFALSWYVGERMRVSGASAEEVLAKEPPPVRTFYVAWQLEAEVLNGGFNQYFWNASPGLVARTPDALLQLGATEVLEVFRGALVRGQQEADSRNALKAQRSLQAFSDSYKQSQLEEYDRKFTAAAASLPAKRIAYVRANEGVFSQREP